LYGSGIPIRLIWLLGRVVSEGSAWMGEKRLLFCRSLCIRAREGRRSATAAGAGWLRARLARQPSGSAWQRLGGKEGRAMKPQSTGSLSSQGSGKRPELALELENVVRKRVFKARRQNAPPNRRAPKPWWGFPAAERRTEPPPVRPAHLAPGRERFSGRLGLPVHIQGREPSQADWPRPGEPRASRLRRTDWPL